MLLWTCLDNSYHLMQFPFFSFLNQGYHNRDIEGFRALIHPWHILIIEKWRWLLLYLCDFPYFTSAKSEWLVQSYIAVNHWNWERSPGHLIPIPELCLLHFPSNLIKMFKTQFSLIYVNLKNKYISLSSLRSRVSGKWSKIFEQPQILCGIGQDRLVFPKKMGILGLSNYT